MGSIFDCEIFCRGECHVRRKGCGCHWQEN
nr:MAG TPA: hypothetical protein [Caudoviricetes sp.]